MSVMSGHAIHKTFYDKTNSSRVNMSLRMKDGMLDEDKLFVLKNKFILELPFNSNITLQSLSFNRYVYFVIILEIMSKLQELEKIDKEIKSNNFSKLKTKHDIENFLHIKKDYRKILRKSKIKFQRILKIRDAIIWPYLRFCLAISGANKISGDHTTENFQAGFQGLLRAVMLYNTAKGSFGNYCKFWIKQGIMENTYQSFLISLPIGTWSLFNKLEKYRKKTKSVDDLAKKCKVKPKIIHDIYERVLINQTANIDDLFAEEEIETYEDLQYNDKYKEDQGYFNILNKQEQKLFAILFGNFELLLENNKLNLDEINQEKARQEN